MKAIHETEVKLAVRDPRALKRRLKQLGFRQIEHRHFESNHLYDFPGFELRKARHLLRLRFEGGRSVVTFKGAPVDSGKYKVRGEIETEVGDGRRLSEILERVGMRETFRYEKYRTTYAPRARSAGAKEAVLDYDETPIGNYLELEGSRSWIDRVARLLGYRPQDYITSSYAALYLRHCAERGMKPGHMVFSSRKF